MGAVAFGLSACRKGQKRVIGVVPQGRTHVFWQTIHAGAEAAAQEHGVEILWNGPSTETDFSSQIQIVDAMINRRVSAIALSPIEKRALVMVVERAVREKIPVVVFDSALETEQYAAWVATDNYAAGGMAAERVAAVLGNKGKVAIVASQPGGASTLLREQGFEDRIRNQYRGIIVADKRFGMADFAKSLAITENMLTAHPDLGALFASNEGSTVGAVQALKARSNREVKLVGFDSSPALIEDLRAGQIDSLIVQDPFRIGYESVASAIKALDGAAVAKKQSLAPRLVRREDLDQPDVQKLLNPDLKKYLGN